MPINSKPLNSIMMDITKKRSIEKDESAWNNLTISQKQYLSDRNYTEKQYNSSVKNNNDPHGFQGTNPNAATPDNILGLALNPGLDSLRKSRNLEHTKQNKIKIVDHLPPSGSEGDMLLTAKNRRIKLNAFAFGRWNEVGLFDSSTTTETQLDTSRGPGSQRTTSPRNFLQVTESTTVLYDSGWVAANANTTVTITHDLHIVDLPPQVQVYVSDNSDPTLGTDTILSISSPMNPNDGLVVEFKNTNVIEVHIGDSKLWDDEGFGNTSVPSDITNGYIRVILSK